MKNNFCCGADC